MFSAMQSSVFCSLSGLFVLETGAGGRYSINLHNASIILHSEIIG
jgi:hypothetical protein